MQNTVYGLFLKMVEEHPDRPAILTGSETLTFKELSSLVDKFACSLPEDVRSVGIVMDHDPLMIAAVLAVLKRGAMYVPAEPSFPRGRIRRMMAETQTQVVVTNRRYARRLKGLSLQFAEDIAENASAREPYACSATPDSPAYVLYTSGTTGRPKGIEVLNRNICHYVQAFEKEFRIGPGDIMLQYSPCTFDIFVEEVFASLLNGAALAIPAEQDKEDVHHLMRFVERHGVTVISGFPYLLAEMNTLDSIPSSLRLLISGGDVLRAAQVDNLVDRAAVYNTYGPSETTVCATYYRCSGGTILEDGTYPIGHPVQGARIEILDAAGNPVPRGEKGEISILGDGVSAGYVGDHDEENKAFVHLEDGSVMYRSGDMGYMLPDGNIAFIARKDSQVMIFGKRVEVLEVESLLYKCQDVEQAVVCAYEAEDKQPYMVAYVVPTEESVRLSDLRQQLSENLASFMIPEFFVKMHEIPLTPNGKPDKDKLPVVLKIGGEIEA